jgi:hypothetical protein
MAGHWTLDCDYYGLLLPSSASCNLELEGLVGVGVAGSSWAARCCAIAITGGMATSPLATSPLATSPLATDFDADHGLGLSTEWAARPIRAGRAGPVIEGPTGRGRRLCARPCCANAPSTHKVLLCISISNSKGLPDGQPSIAPLTDRDWESAGRLRGLGIRRCGCCGRCPPPPPPRARGPRGGCHIRATGAFWEVPVSCMRCCWEHGRRLIYRSPSLSPRGCAAGGHRCYK